MGNPTLLRRHTYTEKRIHVFLSWPVNSSPPGTAYICQWMGSALVQIMACRLFGAKPLSKPMLVGIINWDLRNKVQWNFNQDTKLFIHEKHLKYRLPNGGHFVHKDSAWLISHPPKLTACIVDRTRLAKRSPDWIGINVLTWYYRGIFGVKMLLHHFHITRYCMCT